MSKETITTPSQEEMKAAILASSEALDAIHDLLHQEDITVE